MIITTRNSEEKLVNFVKRLDIPPVGWAAVHFIPGVYMDEQENISFQLVINIIKDLIPEERNMRLFFMSDGSLVFLDKKTSLKEFNIILAKLSESFLETEEAPHSAKVYDLSIAFEEFSNWMKSSYEVEKPENHNEEISPKEKKRYITVDENYAKDLLKKRSLRKDMHIMLVEDDIFTLQLIGNVLSNNSIIRAMDGLDAIETYMLNAPDMVFLDIGLPTFDGHFVLKKILDFDPNAFVVMLSGNSYVDDISKAMSNGAKGFVGKPFSKEKLQKYVEACQKERKS